MPQPLEDSLQTAFGFDSFRPGQWEAIENLLAGRHTLAVMPTGAGKSLIFQLAALQLDGLTLVISPLIALMKDQVDSLARRGIPAAYINSAQPAGEQADCLERLARGGYRIVYVAPERLRSVPFLQALRARTVSLLAVDEAHCISEWGHDFRPDYLHIAEARRRLGNPLTAALTATATPQVQDDIVRLLGLGESARIVTGFNRPNLSLNVRYTSGIPAKLRALSELFSAGKSDCQSDSGSDCQSDLHGAAIIYTGTRRDAEEVAEFTREVVRLPANFYHAGLPAEERTRIQNEFISGRLNVIAATNAFGMGIDRADVRQVIHYSVPGSLEAYYQEAGRAGRDGLPAQVTLLYDPQDRALQEFFIASGVISSEELRLLYRALGGESEIWMTTDDFSRRTDLHPVKIKVGLAELERAGALVHLGDDGFRMLLQKSKWDPRSIETAAARSREHTHHRTEQLDHVIRYAESNSCRRRIVLRHFGDDANPDAPICCDNCLSQKALPEAGGDVAQMSHAERAALIILDASCKLKNRVGKEKLAQILAGSKAQEIKKFNYDKSAYYAKLVVFRKSEIERMIDQLLEMEYFKFVGGLYPVLALTPKGEAALRQKVSIPLKVPKVLGISEVLKARAQFDVGGTVEYTAKLFADGLTPEQIAKERRLALQTIYDHIAQLISVGRISIQQIVPHDIREQIERAVEKVGSTRFLSPIKAILPETIDFNMIRCVVAFFFQTSEVFKTSEVSHPKAPLQYIVELGETGSSDSLPELIAALKSEDGNARRLAASALGKIGNVQAVQPLMDLLATEEKPQVCQYAVKALGRIRDPRAMALLQKMSADESETYYTRDSARVAIQQFVRKTSIANIEPTPTAETPDAISPASQLDPITSYLSSSHPRPLTGNWRAGFALDFHSAFTGADWNRSSVGELTYRLKYQSDPSALPALVEHTRKLFATHHDMEQFDIILPVPSSTPREFSPVHEFCKALARAFGKPAQAFLVKTRSTKPQKEMHTLSQKRDNVAGAFAIKGDITGKCILLVDDLFDSGTTLEEITRLLLKSSAASVNVLTLTRTIHSDL